MIALQPVAEWEDGRRTAQNSENFEWWYFDGLMEDGTVIVAWFGDNWQYGIRQRAVNLEVTRPGERRRAYSERFEEIGHFATDHCDVVIGTHHFSGDLDRYSVRIDAGRTVGVACDLTLIRRVASFRPAAGFTAAVGSSFSWLVAVPEGEVAGTITIDGTVTPVSGSGYHDHNWGSGDPAASLRNWWWGRARVGDRAVIFASLEPRRGASMPILFVGQEQGIEIAAFGTEVAVTAGPLVSHPDPRYKRRISSRIAVRAAGASATFAWRDNLISFNSRKALPFLARKLARIRGRKPWYSRFASDITLTLPGGFENQGDGVLEYFEFQ